MDVQILPLTFLLIINAEVKAFCDNSEAIFLTHPSDQTVKEGENAVFTCKIYTTNHEADTLTWVSDPPLPYNAMAVNYNPRTKQLTSRIGLADVNRDSTSTHACIAQIFDQQGQSMTCLSKEARLHVIYFPKEDELFCSPSTMPKLEGNETFSIRCEVPPGNPPVNMSWYLDGIEIPSSRPNLNNNTQSLLQDLQVHRSFHNKTVACLVTSNKHFPHEQLKCIIGPFVVSDIESFPGYHKESIKNFKTTIQTTIDAENEISQHTTEVSIQTDMNVYQDIDVTKNARYTASAGSLNKTTYVYIAAIGVLGFIAIIITLSATRVLSSMRYPNKDTVMMKSIKISKSSDPAEVAGYSTRAMSEPIYEEASNLSSLHLSKEPDTSKEAYYHESDIFIGDSAPNTCSCSSCASLSGPSSSITEGSSSRYASLHSLGNIKDDSSINTDSINCLYNNQGVIQMHEEQRSRANSSHKLKDNFPVPPPLPK